MVLFGMKPQWRGQPFGTFKVLFNAALYTADIANAAPENDRFWARPAEPEEEGSAEGEGRGR